MVIFGISAILIGVAIDLGSMVLGIRRVFGSGPSGIPVVSVLLYALGSALLASEYGSITWGVFGALCLLHVICQFFVVLLVAAVGRWWRR
jgi:hypothetical protein